MFEAATTPMRFYTTEKLSQNMERTKEGFLLCKNVPIARIGTLLYAPGEIPIPPGEDGLIRIERLPEDVFAPESLESLNGKPVVNDHPHRDVEPDNWKDIAKGTAFNARRGETIYSDLVLADLLIMDEATIKEVLEGKREISGGYDARYILLGPGRGRQEFIIYNHVALVKGGRCGPRCSIKDHAHDRGATVEKNKLTLTERILGRFHTRDEEGLKKDLEEVKDSGEEVTPAGVHIHNHMHTSDEGETGKDDTMEGRVAGLEAAHTSHEQKFKDHCATCDAMEPRLKALEDRMGEKKDETHDSETEEEKKTREEAAAKDKKMKDEEMGEGDTATDKEIEGDLKEEAPEGTGDAAIKAKDSAYLVNAYNDTLATCEIIAPGMRFSTVDSKAKPVDTYRTVCSMRRKALQLGTRDSGTLQIMENVAHRTVDSAAIIKMPCNRVRDFFFAVGAAKRAVATRDMAHSVGSHTNNTGFGGGTGVKGNVRTLADINKLNREAHQNK